MQKNPNIQEPSVKELLKWVKLYSADSSYSGYKDQESAVTEVFQKYRSSSQIRDVLIKVAVLNTYYNTGVLAVPTVAQHIAKIHDIDKRMAQCDPTLVDEIARVTIKSANSNGNLSEEVSTGGSDTNKDVVRTFYSFATKYCFHQNENYFIFDSFVKKMLTYSQQYFKTFKVHDKFTDNDGIKKTFKQSDLHIYSRFAEIYENFIKCYGLGDRSHRDIDHYLWVCGKAVFKK